MRPGYFYNFIVVSMAAVLLLSTSCSAPQEGLPPQAMQSPAQETFLLNAGDKLEITVFGDEELSGDYDIDTRGFITMPLIGEIAANGISVPELQNTLQSKLAEGFIVNPRVSIEVKALRPFYILGEVKNPGSYPSAPGLDVFKAIAIAGGLTPRAVKDEFTIIRGNGEHKHKIAATEDTPVLPGDSIRVRERFF